MKADAMSGADGLATELAYAVDDIVDAKHLVGSDRHTSYTRLAMETLASRLLRGLDDIVALMDQLLDASHPDHVPDRSLKFAQRMAEEGFAVLSMVPDTVWGTSSAPAAGLQRKILELWGPWLEQVVLLYSEDTQTVQKNVTEAASNITRWIHRNGHSHDLPPDEQAAKRKFRELTKPLATLLTSLGSQRGELILIPDTNVLVRTPDISQYGQAFAGANAYTVCLVPGVLGELDAHKADHRNPAFRDRARKVSNRIKGWRNQGSLTQGVRVQGGIFVHIDGREPNMGKTLSWLQADVVDDRIIASILELQRRRPTDRIVLLTGDTIMLAKADAANIPTADTPDPEVDQQGAAKP
jgi:hypothetical protein